MRTTPLAHGRRHPPRQRRRPETSAGTSLHQLLPKTSTVDTVLGLFSKTLLEEDVHLTYILYLLILFNYYSPLRLLLPLLLLLIHPYASIHTNVQLLL